MPVDAPPAEALDLRESAVSLAEAVSTGFIAKPDGTRIDLGYDHKGNPKDGGVFDAQGRVPLHVIRPGLGRGRGRHLYEATMLESNAQKFTGWKQYVNHLSVEAKKAAGGLPRDVRDLGGRITESWWDSAVPPSDRFDQGAVIGMAKPTPFMGSLIDHDPEIVEASISATATGVKAGTHSGERCWIVEGIEDKGSVDWVTEAGAGGRVVSLMEAAMEEDEGGRLALLASMDDNEFTAYLQRERPDVLAEAAKPEAEETDGADDDATNKHTRESEEDDMPITPEALSEALESEDTRAVLLEALDLDTVVTTAVRDTLTQVLPPLLEAAIDTERDLIRATAKADADRRVQVERFKATAHGLIEAAPLPAEFKDEAKAKFSIDEAGEPTPTLNVVDDIGEDGEVTKKADDKLKEAVDAEIAKQKTLYAAANPTRVRGQGPSTSVEEMSDEQKNAIASGVAPGSKADALLAEAGFEDTSKVYEAHDLQGA